MDLESIVGTHMANPYNYGGGVGMELNDWRYMTGDITPTVPTNNGTPNMYWNVSTVSGSDLSMYDSFKYDTIKEEKDPTKNTIYLDKMRALYEMGLLGAADQQRYKAIIRQQKKEDKKYKHLKKLMDGVTSQKDWAKIMSEGVSMATAKPALKKQEAKLFDEEDQLPEADPRELARYSDEELGIAYSYTNDKGDTAHDILCERCKAIVTFTLDAKKGIWNCLEPKHTKSFNDNHGTFLAVNRRALCSSITTSNIWPVNIGNNGDVTTTGGRW